MHVIHLQANMKWGVVNGYGDLIGIGPTNQYLFSSKAELVRVLNSCGLTVRGTRVMATA